VTLLGRGSTVHGYYRNNVQTGQSRIAVAADWIDDPSTGCFIKFDNAAVSDMTGVTGIAGNVDAHYLERFGAAVAMTAFGSGTNILQSLVSKGGNTYLSFGGGGGSGGVEEIASTILRKQMEIVPTITVYQGAMTAVFVNKILDFSPCYQLQLKGK
jgi:type IV secretion system protein VirB10